MPYYLNFEVPGLPKTANKQLRSHWRDAHAESLVWHKEVWFATRGKLPQKPLKKAKLILTRVSARSPDSDGLVSSFKYVIDGLVKAGVLVDDGYSIIGMQEYRWEACERNKGKIRVIVISDEN